MVVMSQNRKIAGRIGRWAQPNWPAKFPQNTTFTHLMTL